MNQADRALLLPSLASFTLQMKRLSLKPTDSLVCYDDYGLYSSPRMAWTFTYFGATNVRVLNGGFLKWRREGRRIETGPSGKLTQSAKKGDKWEVSAAHRAQQDLNQVQRAAYYAYNKMSTNQIIDARSPERYNGEVPERGEGIRSGKISGSSNLLYRELINAQDGTLKSKKEIADVFYKAKLDPFLTSIVYSGRGISACVLDLAMRSLGNDKTIVYLGSWD